MPRLSDIQQLEKRLKDRLVKAMATYNLIEDDDRILVGLSGGKDSLCLLELLSQRQKIQHPRFEMETIHVRMDNIEYETDLSYLVSFTQALGVPFHVRTTGFDPSTDTRRSPCFLCSWYRRKVLFNVAQELGCNKIALGHHQDDILQTTLMGLFYQGQFGSMPALLRMRKMPLSIIRPLCMEKEEDIVAYAQMRDYQKQIKHCPYEHSSHRSEIKKLFEQIERMNPEARSCIWRALNKEGKMTDP
ncbi:MAG: tRNA 2-thiocytidine biosynthesis protein TtcA [Prevotella sp.]|nr:tRNA 2-thiocytidine biosynthesis protein TtcA [Prevotella sp.]